MQMKQMCAKIAFVNKHMIWLRWKKIYRNEDVRKERHLNPFSQISALTKKLMGRQTS